MKKIIDEHIKKQTRDRLGSVDIGRGKTYKFRSDIEEIELQSITWTRRSYIFNRGENFALGNDFFDYSGQINSIYLQSGETGGCNDANIEQYSNIEY